jgi:hypothetical protein
MTMKENKMSQKQEIQLLIDKYNVLSQISAQDIDELNCIINKLPWELQLILIFQGEEISIYIEKNKMTTHTGSSLNAEEVLRIVSLQTFYDCLKVALIEKIEAMKDKNRHKQGEVR